MLLLIEELRIALTGIELHKDVRLNGTHLTGNGMEVNQGTAFTIRFRKSLSTSVACYVPVGF